MVSDLVKIVPDYLRPYLDTERVVYLVLLLTCAGLGYYLLQLNDRRKRVTNNARQFANNVPKYKNLRQQYIEGRPRIPKELRENPLSFMERVIPQEFLTNLQPTNDGGDEGYEFQLRLESKDVTKILELVSTLEKEPLLKINEFSLIRESLNSTKFHSVMKLRTVDN